MRFEIEVTLDEDDFVYAIAFDLSKGTKQLRVIEEKLTLNSEPIISRALSDINSAVKTTDSKLYFPLDSQLIALPMFANSNVLLLRNGSRVP